MLADLNKLLLNLLVTPETTGFVIALAYSFIFPVIWLAFCLWLNRNHPRRSGFLMMAFFFGAMVVMPALPLEKFVATLSTNSTLLIILWAISEELLKLVALLFVVFYKSKHFNGPRDYPIVAITIGLGFAALENTLYILYPVLLHNFTQATFLGGMRFLGANLMHAATVSLSGFALGFAYFKSPGYKVWFVCIGLAIASSLHSAFNLLVVNADQTQLWLIFGMLWVFVLTTGILWICIIKMEGSTFIKNIWASSFAKNEKVFNEIVLKMNISPDNNSSIREILKQKGILPSSSDYMNFERLCDFLRTHYERHLKAHGMNEADSITASSKLISDTISAKTIGIVFKLLKEKEKVVVFGKSVIKVRE